MGKPGGKGRYPVARDRAKPWPSTSAGGFIGWFTSLFMAAQAIKSGPTPALHIDCPLTSIRSLNPSAWHALSLTWLFRCIILSLRFCIFYWPHPTWEWSQYRSVRERQQRTTSVEVEIIVTGQLVLRRCLLYCKWPLWSVHHVNTSHWSSGLEGAPLVTRSGMSSTRW